MLELTSGAPFDSINKKSLAHDHVVRNVMLKFSNKLTVVFAPTRNVMPDARKNPGATKIPLALRGVIQIDGTGKTSHL